MAEVVFQGKVTLVTGASSGMGEQFARQLALRGAELVLVARSGDKLETLAEELRSQSAQPIHVIAADLTKGDAVDHILGELKKRGLEVEHLVNNAGVGRAMAVHKDDPFVILKMIQLNCFALTELTTRLLPKMVERGSGGIIQVASVIGFTPCPYQSVYAATKAYVKSLAEGMAIELEGTGVRTTAVCPGHVRTGFQEAAGFGAAEMKVPGELSAERTVQLGLRAYERHQTVVVTGLMNRLSVFATSLLPRSWVARISAGVLKKMGRFD